MFLIRHMICAGVLMALPAAASAQDETPELLKRGLQAEGDGELDEAIKLYREAVSLDPANHLARLVLGTALLKKGDAQGSLREARRAVALDPKEYRSRLLLGEALQETNDPRGAVDAFERAAELEPDSPLVLYNYADGLTRVGRTERAIETLEKLVENHEEMLAPKLMLAELLLSGCREKEAARVFRKVKEARSDNEGLAEQIDERLKKVERIGKMRDQLPEVIEGKKELTEAADLILAAEIAARSEDRQRDAMGLYLRAFEKEPKLAKVPEVHQYNAVCAALLAAVQEEESDEKKAELRGKALGWLRAEMEDWRKAEPEEAAGERGVARTLRYWTVDPDLESVREPEALSKLPAEERKQWEQFWSDLEDAISEAAVVID